MKEKIVKRLLGLIPMLFFISLVSFLLMQMAPGDPLQAYITPQMNPDDIERIRVSMGLDQPIMIQYLKWLVNAAQGNLGYSLISHRPVIELAHC